MLITVNSKIRINKLLVENNICSRREADKYIESGKIKINNKIAKLGCTADIGDKIEINITDNNIYYIYNKKPNEVVNNKIQIENSELMVVDNLHSSHSGLILLTNNKSLIKRAQKEKIQKSYNIKTVENIRIGIANILKRPVDINGIKYNDIISATINENNIRITALENNISNIPKILNALNLTINRLERVSILNHNNKNMKYGDYHKIESFEID
ncbi:MAG: S4 domain-containing protein [Cyanobium sp. MAG06]|nr:S4 domain-containing protein [Cyanobium sp. MAG06]